MFYAFITSFIVLLMGLPAFADVVINEIHYNPADIGVTTAGLSLEFIELYNPGTTTVNLAGYNFSKGVTYTFPSGTTLKAGSYLVVVSDSKQNTWKNKSYAVLGPYTGTLSDNGERITLVRPDKTVVDDFKYSDTPPWPQSPDGYDVNSSLERIAWDLPADDYHSWRASLSSGGTPGAQNSVFGIPSRPVITGSEITPKNPASKDAVTVRYGFDAADIIDSVTLQWQKADQGNASGTTLVTYLVSSSSSFRYFKGSKSPSEGDLWTKPDFVDTKWLTGRGGFGYGQSNYIRTTLSDMRNKYSTVYMRQAFTVKSAKDLKSVILEVNYTGGYLCYLNGIEISRANVPQSVTNETLATKSHAVNSRDIITISNANKILTEGKNVFALVGVNDKLNQTLFVIRAGLREGVRQEDVPSEFSIHAIPMQRIAGSAGNATYEAKIPAAASQSLIRYNAKVKLKSGNTLTLPYVSDLVPFHSYFVYNNDIKSKLPVLWPYYQKLTNLTESQRMVTGAIIQPTDEAHPLVFDGANIYASRNGHKIKFVKSNEYKDYRTFVLFPETSSGGTTSGASTSYRENLSYWLFNQMGVVASRTNWFRVVLNKEHTQQLLSEQVNGNFFEVRKFNSSGELFKLGYQNPIWENHGNLENGSKYIDALLKEINVTNQTALHAALTKNLTVDELLSYSTASVFTSNWDGFFNNQWWYLNPDTGKWLICPWDLDKTWGFTDDNPMFVEMPLAYPLDGKAKYAARDPGPILGPFHKDKDYNQQYLDRLKYEMDHKFSEKFLYDKIDEVEKFLLDDLALQETYTAKKDDALRKQITDSYATIKDFIKQRRAYLLKQPALMAVPVEEWPLY